MKSRCATCRRGVVQTRELTTVNASELDDHLGHGDSLVAAESVAALASELLAARLNLLDQLPNEANGPAAALRITRASRRSTRHSGDAPALPLALRPRSSWRSRSSLYGTPMPLPRDLVEMLSAFADARVRYLVVGGARRLTPRATEIDQGSRPLARRRR